MDIRPLLALAFTVIVWGIHPIFIRGLSLALGPADHLVIRYVIVALVYIAGLVATGGWRVAREDWPRLLAVSIFGMVGYNLGSAFGFELVSAGMGSLIIGTQPLLIALAAAIMEREKLSVTAIAGLVIGFCGIFLLVAKDLAVATDMTGFLVGCAEVFISGLCWAIYVVGGRPLVHKYGSFGTTALTITLATAVMVPLLASSTTLVTLKAMTVQNWVEMAYMAGLSTFIATITWNYGAARVAAAAAGAFLYLIPIIGVAAGAHFLGEIITAGMVLGGGLILAGVAITQFAPALRLQGGTALAAILFAVTMWGLIPVAMRFLVLELTPATAMVLRVYLAGLLAILVLFFVGVRPIAWRDWGRIAIAALAGNLGYQVLAAYGMETVPASWTGLLFGLEPVFIALFAVLLAGERITFWLVVGITVAMLGTAALMIGSTLTPTGDVSLMGLALVTISTMGWGIYTVVIRPVSGRYGSFPVTCVALAISALPMPFFVGGEFPAIIGGMGLAEWLAVAFVVMPATFLATTAWNYALGHMESLLAGVFLYVQPVVAAIGGILILGEKLSWPLAAGGGLIILGVGLAQFGPLLQRMQWAKGDSSSTFRQ
ncbi:MAG: DMT family transporter [Alphaproteobacteria bacterium]|nr:DMT family transporter [Alphaproteobacteria bacterium]